jgi:hypothetical protein
MRALISMAVAATLAFALGAPRQAEAVPTISFGTGVRLPGGCTDAGAAGLDCTGTGQKTLTVIITVGSEGMQGYSFGAKWDDGTGAVLSGVSGTQAWDATLYVSKVPPLVNAAFSPDNGPRSAVSGITQSTGSSAGTLINWQALSASPDSSLYTGAILQGASYRAGRVTVTIDNTTGTSLQIGFFEPNQDSFLAAGGGEITPNFTAGIANFNGGPVPEPGTTMLMGLGLLGLALASRSSRK